MYGVKETEILKAGCTYMVIGAEAVHSQKIIMSEPHVTYTLPFIRSRRREDNRLWIWNPK